MTANLQAKLDYLKELGFSNIEPVEVYGYDTEIQYEGEYNCSILAKEFEVGDEMRDILKASDFYSCCGDILDKDYMICPSCKEHC